jgi:hypothetical protein
MFQVAPIRNSDFENIVYVSDEQISFSQTRHALQEGLGSRPAKVPQRALAVESLRIILLCRGFHGIIFL